MYKSLQTPIWTRGGTIVAIPLARYERKRKRNSKTKDLFRKVIIDGVPVFTFLFTIVYTMF